MINRIRSWFIAETVTIERQRPRAVPLKNIALKFARNSGDIRSYSTD
jgi:hypothetical protein